jgi:hypothetical protein
VKKINSIGYAHKIIAVISFFLLLLPFILHLIWLITNFTLLRIIIKISFSIGTIISILFLLLLKIELHQDKVINTQYQKNKNSRILLPSGFYECQTCGNRSLQAINKYCTHCGVNFKDFNEVNKDE